MSGEESMLWRDRRRGPGKGACTWRGAVCGALLVASGPAVGFEVDPVRPQGSAGDLRVETRTIEIEDGRSQVVEAGTLLVPENRRQPESALISIPFYRLRSTAEVPARPIFLLAGGPGSSWIDRFENPENYDEVLFYRGIADVVLFDQRGAGHAEPTLHCDGLRRQYPLDRALEPTAIADELREMALECRQAWVAAGVDLAGYNTVENASDVLELRQALGYEKMTLVGGSYGSHLALALLRMAPDAIDRVVLYGVEGLDRTWDDPRGRLAVLERIAGSAETSATLGPQVPAGGLIGVLEDVIERLEEGPAIASLGEGEEQVDVVIDAELLRRVAGFQAGRRSRPNVWPEFLLDLAAADYSVLARGAYALRQLRLDDPMHYMMDCASGISPARRQLLLARSERHLLGDLNSEYATLCPVWQAPDLGEEFRAPLRSSVPALVVHGTWDTSTPIENAREVIAGLERGQLVEVIGGHHGALYNLYAHWPPAHDQIGAFLRGEEVRFPTSVTLPPVQYAPRGGN